MKMIRAIVRPEKVEDVLDTLMKKGYCAATRMNVLGRGKQRGLKVGVTYYDEIPKEMIMIVVNDEDEEKVVKIIADSAKTSKTGTYGDGKIFISDVDRAVTVSSGEEVL